LETKIEKTEKKISQTINLTDLFGKSVDRVTAARVGQEMIDVIIARTKKGDDINGAPFKRYDKDYVGSKAFRRYGKSSNKINMTLKGSMLSDLDFKIDGENIVLGFNDKTQELKAANHNSGVTVKEREFFGVSSSELTAIEDKFKADVKETLDKTDKKTLGQLLDLATVERLGAKKRFRDTFEEMFEKTVVSKESQWQI